MSWPLCKTLGMIIIIIIIITIIIIIIDQVLAKMNGYMLSSDPAASLVHEAFAWPRVPAGFRCFAGSGV